MPTCIELAHLECVFAWGWCAENCDLVIAMMITVMGVAALATRATIGRKERLWR